MLLVGMGENYIRRHTFAGEPWYEGREREYIERFKKEGVEIRAYDPLMEQPDMSPPMDRSTASDGSAAAAEDATSEVIETRDDV
jgi:hypothetical protein